MSPWYKFYQDRLNSSYLEHVSRKYRPFIDEIKKAIQDKDSIVESGCGMANITRLILEECECHIKSIDVYDVCPYMLSLAVQNTSHIYGIKYSIRNMLRHYDLFDVCYAHGVLEHFSDEDIRRITKLQKSFSRSVLHYVPSSRYETPSFGDERLLTPDQWHDICQPDEIIEFNDGYDLILKWN